MSYHKHNPECTPGYLTAPTTKAVGFRDSGCLGPRRDFGLTAVVASPG